MFVQSGNMFIWEKNVLLLKKLITRANSTLPEKKHTPSVCMIACLNKSKPPLVPEMLSTVCVVNVYVT